MNNFVLNGRLNEGSSTGKEAGRGVVALNGQHEITHLQQSVPYLVTESNGHMFPTKFWDPEERRTEHAVRHLRVIDAAYATAQHSGSISWCAFDYNTHHDMGAGDKICHHGVFDMYRQPKFAAYAYRSQKDPKQELVLEPLTCWASGERSEGKMGPIWVLHNCEYIELHKDGKPLELNGCTRIFPARGIFKGLPHPPSVIWDVPGSFQDAQVKGFIAGKQVIERKFLANPIASRLRLVADQPQLSAKRPEATRLVLQAEDQIGNRLQFLFGTVRLRIVGAKTKIYADEVQSPKISEGAQEQEAFATLSGGAAGLWLLSCGQSGKVSVEGRVLGYVQLTAQLQLEIV